MLTVEKIRKDHKYTVQVSEWSPPDVTDFLLTEIDKRDLIISGKTFVDVEKVTAEKIIKRVAHNAQDYVKTIEDITRDLNLKETP